MKTHNVEQGTQEWLELRMGVPTASDFGRILTPTGKPSTSSDKLVAEKIFEAIAGEPIQGASTSYMSRGTDMEAEARLWYAWTRDVDAEQVGFVTDNAGEVGCSPDFLVGNDGLGEIKCLSATNHVLAALGSTKFLNTYRPQVQGQLWITDRGWCDMIFYSPKLEPLVVRIFRDEPYIDLLSAAVRNVSIAIEDGVRKLQSQKEHQHA